MGGVQEKVVFDTRDIVNSYKIYTTGNVQVYGDYIPVDPYKTYRFSIWIKEDNNDSTLYFGYDAYNSSKTEINSYNSAGTAGSNYYFWNGDLTVNKWRKITGYLFPCNAGTGWTNSADTTSSNYRMDCATAHLRMRFLNYDGTGYGTGAGTTAWYALPKVEEVQDSLSAFTHNYSDYIINPTTGNVGIGVASPDANYRLTLAAGGIKAESNILNQPAGYFSSTNSGYAIQTGTGNVLISSLSGRSSFCFSCFLKML